MSNYDNFEISNIYFPNIATLLQLLNIDDYWKKRTTNKLENSNKTEENIEMAELSIFETWRLEIKTKKRILKPSAYLY